MMSDTKNLKFNAHSFYWAAGIENTFVPQTRAGLRSLDEYDLTQHYEFWRQDFDRVASLGVSHLRWGIPWYRVNPSPGSFQWDWIDESLDYLVNKKGIQPIIDLVHYGTPSWLDNSFLNANYPQWVAEYAHAFASRYGAMIEFYTPLNEPTVNADFCGRLAFWPPYLKGADGYVKLMMQIARGMILTAEAICDADPDAVLVQVEATGWMWTQDEKLAGFVQKSMANRYLAVDLVTGRFDQSHLLWPLLNYHGVSQQDLDWLSRRAIDIDILGINFYPWSGGEVIMHHAGRAPAGTEALLDLNPPQPKSSEPAVSANSGPRVHRGVTGHHLADLLRDAWHRYRIPLMITETSATGDPAARAAWMDETIAAVRTVREEGIPVIGYTWFPVISMIDWAYRRGRQPLENYLLHLGLWDSHFDTSGTLQRRPTPLVDRYQEYAAGLR